MKIKNPIRYIVLIIFFSTSIIYSQNETKKWYFGIYAALDFNTTPPTVISNSAMQAGEGCASICDPGGNLLFYTDGTTIWDRTHVVMANGSGLFGDPSSTQSSVIIKQPGSSTIYYVFTAGGSYGVSPGLNYSIVDISLASGNGSVTAKNFTVFSSGTEKLAAVKHKNNLDYWILTHDWNNNNFRANLLSSSGFNHNPVISSIGTILSGIGGNGSVVGQMKFSPDGKKVGLAVHSPIKTFELYDFDALLGVVSNSLILGNNFDQAYGCEFSPDGKKLYGGTWLDGNIWQWDLCSGNNTGILNSKVSIAFAPWGSIGALQLAPDGKIYVVKSGNHLLGCINNPNLAGVSCNYVDSAISLAPNTAGYGLPNFTSSYFWPGSPVTISSVPGNTICSGESITLTASGAVSYTWNSSNIGQSIVVSPTISSTYSVVSTVSTGCKFDTEFSVTVKACTDLKSEQIKDYLNIYPVPAKDEILLSIFSALDGSATAKLRRDFHLLSIYNNLGLLLREEELRLENNAIKIRTEDLPSGVYSLQLKSSSNEIVTKRFVIAR